MTFTLHSNDDDEETRFYDTVPPPATQNGLASKPDVLTGSSGDETTWSKQDGVGGSGGYIRKSGHVPSGSPGLERKGLLAGEGMVVCE